VASGAIVRVGVQEEPASLNPFDVRSRTMAARHILAAVLPQLFVVAPDGSVKGSLVDDASVRESLPSSVSFSLQRDAKWSDGTAVSVDDVRFTLDAIKSDQWHGPRDGYDAVSAVEGSGRRVVLRFSSPLPGWKRLFSGDDYVLPAHRLRGPAPIGQAWAAGPDLSAGPLKLAGVTPGLEVDLDANPTWWGGRVAYDRVRVLVVPDGRTLEQLLARGDLDVAFPLASTNRVNRFRALKGVTVSVADAGGWLTSLVANTEKLSVARRRALLSIVDRDRFVAVLLAGEVDLAMAWRPGRPPDRPAWGSVVAGAPSFGTDDVTVAFAAPDSESMSGLLGRAMQTRIQATKVTLDLDFTDAAEVNSTWRPSGRFDLLLTSDIEWPVPCWRCQFAADAVGAGNWSRAKDLDDLAASADRGDASDSLEARLHADAVVMPMWRPKAVVAARGVKGVLANSWAAGPLWNVSSWRPS
jgi:ABC-type transport system substrate-binding protein